MPTKAQITAVLFAWIKAESGVTTIIANQKAPRPARPYATLNFLNPTDRLGSSIDQQSSVNVGGVWKVATSGMRSAVASINVFGQNANDILSKVRDSLDRPDVIETFAAGGLVHLDESQISDLTALQETAYEERAQMDLTVAFVSESEVDVGTIEHVEINGTAQGRAIPEIKV